MNDLHELNEVINDILQYTPHEWKGFQGYYIDQMRAAIRKMWPTALRSPGFIVQDLQVQLKWYYSFNYHAVENDLLCKVVIHGPGTDTPSLAYQPQGRLSSTRYKKTTPKTQQHDMALREAMQNAGASPQK